MVRVFSSQTTKQLIKKLELTQWRKSLQEKINQSHQDMSDVWKMYAIEDRIKIKESEFKNIDDLTPEARLLRYDFSVATQNGNNDIAIEIIGKLSTIWRN